MPINNNPSIPDNKNPNRKKLGFFIKNKFYYQLPLDPPPPRPPELIAKNTTIIIIMKIILPRPEDFPLRL